MPGMLRMGEWAGKASASHYASADEQDRAGMALNILEASDDDAEGIKPFTNAKRAKGFQGMSSHGTLPLVKVKAEL